MDHWNETLREFIREFTASNPEIRIEYPADSELAAILAFYFAESHINDGMLYDAIMDNLNVLDSEE